MKYTYVPAFFSLSEIATLIGEFELENPIVAASFDEFLTKIDPSQDEVMVHSAIVFSSLIDLLAATQKVSISSLSEPWLSEIDSHLSSLYDLATQIHTARTCRGLNRAREQGKVLGRVHGQKLSRPQTP